MWFMSVRVYTDEARHDMDLLSNTWLVDEFEQALKSMNDYKEATGHLLDICPAITRYMENNVLFLAGDWPTWYYNKKIICQVGKICTSHQPTTTTIPSINIFKSYQQKPQDSLTKINQYICRCDAKRNNFRQKINCKVVQNIGLKT